MHNSYRSYIPRIQRSTIQNLLYPKFSNKMDFIHHKEYLLQLKKIQKKNKEKEEELKKEMEEKKKEIKPYKLKCFENIPSKYEQQTKEWIERESKIRRPKIEVNNSIISINNKKCKFPYYEKDGISSNINNSSLFDNYYNKIKKEKKLNKVKSQEYLFNKQNLLTNNDSIKINKSEIKTSISNSVGKTNDNYYNKNEISFDSGIILPKLEHNYLKENIDDIKSKIILNKKDNNNTKFINKDYGKIPDYLIQYKIEMEKKNKMLNEQNNYPKGKLLPENERLQILHDLINTKKLLENTLEKMSITKKTILLQKNKEELEKKLIQIEKDINIFSKKNIIINE